MREKWNLYCVGETLQKSPLFASFCPQGTIMASGRPSGLHLEMTCEPITLTFDETSLIQTRRNDLLETEAPFSVLHAVDFSFCDKGSLEMD